MNHKLKELLRTLRKKGTPAETVFWEVVRNRNLHGYKFYRQHPIVCSDRGDTWIFIADFYCTERNLVVEIDGPVHDRQRDYDDLRTRAINEHGLQVIRFTNDEIEHDLDRVIATLTEKLDSPL